MSALTTMREAADSAKPGKKDAAVQKAAPNAMTDQHIGRP
jgi:hypothetical protein